MEYTSVNDFYFKLKAIYNNRGDFSDYVLQFISDNFYKATKLDPKNILGEKISKVLVDNTNRLGLKEVYLRAVPKTNCKFEILIEDLKRWYLVSLFNDHDDNMIVFYNDISCIKMAEENSSAQLYNLNSNILSMQEASKMLYFRDKLTGLYNRNFVEEEINRLDTKRQLPISIIVGDINGLKLINDAFGHSMGDKAIKRAADIMKNISEKKTS